MHDLNYILNGVIGHGFALDYILLNLCRTNCIHIGKSYSYFDFSLVIYCLHAIFFFTDSLNFIFENSSVEGRAVGVYCNDALIEFPIKT